MQQAIQASVTLEGYYFRRMRQSGMNENESIEATSPAPSRRWGVTLAWVLVLSLLGVVGFRLVNASKGPLELGQPAPDFVLTTFDGREFDTTELRGQVIVVNVWASWCVTCVDEAEELEQAYQMFKDRGVIFLGVDWSDTESKALAYLERFGITYPNGPDIGQRIYESYRVTGVPETFVIAADGRLVGVKISAFSSIEEIVEMVNSALQQ
jgi:cytochrome c biogenesis protein CcmG/thiol:disulfide interchange protein DsbE